MTPPETWYLLIHQLPARPLYFRARIRKLLAGVGAAALKKAVYALPKSPEALERFTRIGEEIRTGGGEVFVLEARFAGEGNAAPLLEAARQERAADYARILRETRAARARARHRGPRSAEEAGAKLRRLRLDLERVRSIDFSSSGGDAAAATALEELGQLLEQRGARPLPASSLVGHTWLTRRGLHVDRLACAWVVRRFIDPEARFRFAEPGAVRAEPGELAFDVPGGDFSHEAGRCSVETLLAKAGIRDPAAKRIAEIVHDIDLKDERYRHPETAGIEQLVAGIVRGHDQDRARLDRGLELFDDLHRSFSSTARVRLSRDRAPLPPGRGVKRRSR